MTLKWLKYWKTKKKMITKHYGGRREGDLFLLSKKIISYFNLQTKNKNTPLMSVFKEAMSRP